MRNLQARKRLLTRKSDAHDISSFHFWEKGASGSWAAVGAPFSVGMSQSRKGEALFLWGNKSKTLASMMDA